MNVNLSSVFLNFLSISYSPIITISPKYVSTSTKFHDITIKNIFNIFFYQICKNSINNHFFVQRSTFSSTLSSAIFLTSLEITNFSQIFTNQTIYDYNYQITININNCCFSKCRSSSLYPHGGAIRNLVSSCLMNLTSCIFKNCYSDAWGGAIMTESQNFEIKSTLFAGCQAETGMAIFYNSFKCPNIFNFFLSMNQVGFISNRGKHHVTDLNISQLHCLNSNFTNNVNEVQSRPSDSTQYCCAFSFLAPAWNENFKFININGNKGDFLIEFNEKPNGYLFYVNIIGNTGLNFFFNFDRVIYPSDFGTPDIIMNEFNFFNNKANDDSVGIFVGNAGTEIHFQLQNCIFDYSSSSLNSMLNGHLESGGTFDQSLDSCVTHTMNEIFIKPSICEIDIELNTFTPSNVLISSEKFSPSNEYTSSSVFSKSDIFLTSSKFTSSSNLFQMTSNYSTEMTVIRPTKPFTPSSPFTSSNTFSPQRTKVPDPMNFLHNAEISGAKNIFTKEELKKAAAPVSISIVLIIVAIVMTIFYLNRRIRELRRQNSVPQFDSSLNDETESDSDYSYSYYTYTYTYYSFSTNSYDDTDNYSNSQSFNEMNDYDYSDFTYSN